MTAKRGLFWYVDGELFCFPVSGDEADTVSNNHRRFWETLPHSLTGGMPYNYFPRGRVELRHECGCCAYTCPATIPLVQSFRAGKQRVRNAMPPRKG